MDDQARAARRKLYLRWALRVAAAFALGSVCPLLPEEKQVVCHLAAKLISLVVGGS